MNYMSRRQVVPTDWFADTIEPMIQDRIKQATFEDNRKSEVDSGAIDDISSDAAKILGMDEPSMYRRLFSIRQKEFLSLNLSIADALLMALDSSLHTTDVPVLAGNEEGAREMVDAWCDLDGNDDLNEFERRLFAKKIHRFCRGVIVGNYRGLDELEAVVAVCQFLHAMRPEPIDELAEAA